MNRNKIIMRTASIALSAVMAAAGECAVFAASPERLKDENVYVNLNEDGSVSGIYVVNEYTSQNAGTVTDYGDYETVKNLTTDEEIQLSGNKVTADVPEGKFYYQGNLKTKEMPWKIDIVYYLDGKEIAAEDLAGKSGNLEIRMKISENKACDADFFENYLLQATIVLDTKTCTEIKADGATEANVASNRQLLYNLMAGQEKEISITAKVQDFEMDGITFQAVPMGFDIEDGALDLSEIEDKTADVKDAAQKLDDGAKELQSGVQEAVDGGGQLVAGSSELESGVAELQDGMGAVVSGSDSLEGAAQALSQGIAEYTAGVGNLTDGIRAYVSGAQQLGAGASQLAPLENLYQVSDGINALYQAVVSADTQESLQSGADALSAGLGAICQQLSALQENSNSEGLQQLVGMLSQFQASASELASNTENLGSQISLCAEAVGQVASAYEQLTGAVSGQVDAANEELAQAGQSMADSVNGQIADINNQISAAAGSINAQVDSAIGAVQAAVDAGSIDQEIADGIIGQLDASRAGETFVSTVEAPVLSAAVTLPDASQIQTIFEQLSAAGTQLSEAATVYQGAAKQIGALAESLPQMPETGMLETLSSALNEAYAGAQSLSQGVRSTGEALGTLAENTASFSAASEGVKELLGGFAALQENDETLINGADMLAEASQTLVDGVSALAGGTGELNAGIGAVSAGVDALYDGAGSLNSGMSSMMDGLTALSGGTGELAEGTGEFREETGNIDEQMDEELDKVLEKISGGDYIPVSFTSEKNSDIGLVQFVMKTDGISIPEPEEKEEERTEENFWDRVKGLF